MDEERWLTVGQAQNGQLLVVSHTVFPDEQRSPVRILSARQATRRERQTFEVGR